ncbi:hypothetical protein J6590_031959 [Homalodisca vitripennis]|nr:hypothetical protein J6590_031959 [Homalodisca vitripennis]
MGMRDMGSTLQKKNTLGKRWTHFKWRYLFFTSAYKTFTELAGGTVYHEGLAKQMAVEIGRKMDYQSNWMLTILASSRPFHKTASRRLSLALVTNNKRGNENKTPHIICATLTLGIVAQEANSQLSPPGAPAPQLK